MYEYELNTMSGDNSWNLISAIIVQAVDDYKHYNNDRRQDLKRQIDDESILKLTSIWSFIDYHKDDEPKPKRWYELIKKKSEIERAAIDGKLNRKDRCYLSAVGFFKSQDYEHYAELIGFPYTGEQIMAELDKHQPKKVSRRAKKVS